MHTQPSDAADALDTAVAFARTVRSTGVPVTTGRIRAFVEALEVLDAGRRLDVYWAGRSTLCGNRDDLGRYDRAFEAFFEGEAPHTRLRPGTPSSQRPQLRSLTAPLHGGDDDGDDDELHLTASASRHEVLRQRDLASLTPADRDLVNRLLAAMSLPGEPRRTRRHHPWHRGGLDEHATVREALRGMGDPRVLHRRRHRRRPRTVVLLVDVSGSMGTYADALLRFAHVAVGRGGGTGRAEAFTIGTRLTRITRELRLRDPEHALRAAGRAIPDWSGGTRLGEVLQAFVDRWGRRGAARRAVVVVFSDGWERGGTELLGTQAEQLSRLAHRLVWVNPHAGKDGYAPVQGGIVAALPHLDDLLAGHSLDTLEKLLEVVRNA